eukprot:9483547-Pyramimonas_sp.AAC.1
MSPDQPEGRWPRYRLLRKSLGTLCMLPVAVDPSEAQAFAMESLVIKFANPECNNRDQGYQRRGARQ